MSLSSQNDETQYLIKKRKPRCNPKLLKRIFIALIFCKLSLVFILILYILIRNGIQSESKETLKSNLTVILNQSITTP